jgi:cysteine desulfurase / selenocysteine lyase
MKQIKKDFPLLQQSINGHPIIYCDNASTTQKPRAMLDAVDHFYTTSYANTYRGIYPLGEIATEQYEEARTRVASFIHARSASEIIFTSGTTAGINFIATMLARTLLKPGDEIVITALEHHANLLPWQQLMRLCGIRLSVIPVLPDGMLDMDAAESLITTRTKLVAITHCSNALGTHVDLSLIGQLARAVGAFFLVDAAQSVPHMLVNIQNIDPDFLVFSGHKMCAPTGIGVLYIKQELHDQIEPYQFGGGMVFSVNTQTSQWLAAPHKFEAGTPPIAQAIGLGAAIQYLQSATSPAALHAHTALLCTRLIDGLAQIPAIRILGNVEHLKKYGHLVSFVHDTIHAHDIAAYLGQYGICVRAGHHCAQPLAATLTYVATVRVSFYIYNTTDDVDTLLKQLHRLQ